MIKLDASFWNNKYLNNKTGWDLGKISKPLKMYFEQLEDKDLRILIPGGGNSYEASYLFNKGFKNVFVVDLARQALDNISVRTPNFPKNNLLHQDFFNLKGSFDIIIEQTFFCAINPKLRTNYINKVNELLNSKGKLIGLFFDAELNTDHPPFGGSKEEYKTYFKSKFNILTMEPCYNSSEKRVGMELFVRLQKIN